ncbi:MAG TPA: TauD/TfdA family dioxygenase [Kofleriaceae bacterium]|jgi:hypothetical protein
MTALITDELRDRGFSVVRGPLHRTEYFELARTLGEFVGVESIALRPGAHAYVAKPGRVPLHTDHPQVGVIGWLCEAQDDADGASLLLDARPVVESMPEEERELLYRVHLACPPLEGGPPTERWPVLRRTDRGDAVFCSPWLRAIDATAGQEVALARFRTDLSNQAKVAVTEVRLAPGDALFVDNRRVLHGRRSIADASQRRLLRTWLRTDCHPGVGTNAGEHHDRLKEQPAARDFGATSRRSYVGHISMETEKS